MSDPHTNILLGDDDRPMLVQRDNNEAPENWPISISAPGIQIMLSLRQAEHLATSLKVKTEDYRCYRAEPVAYSNTGNPADDPQMQAMQVGMAAMQKALENG